MRNGAEEMIMMRRRQWQQQEQQQQQQQRQQQQQFASAQRPSERRRERKNKMKKHDPLLCKCLTAMGMYRFVDRLDNFNQFIRMSSDQCRLYGPEFVIKYAELHARIEALCAGAFSALDDFGSRDSVEGELDDNNAGASSAPSSAVTVPVAAKTQGKNLSDEAEVAEEAAEKNEKEEAGEEEEEEEEEEGGGGGGGGGEKRGEGEDRRDRVRPRPLLRRSDSLSPGSGGGGGSGSLIPCTEGFCWDDGFEDAQTIRVCSHLFGTCDANQRWSRRNLQN